MSYRQDHKVRTHFDEASGNLTSLIWTNYLDQEDAPGGFPSKLTLSSSGIPISAFWSRLGKLHRDGDLPAAIYFDDVGLPTMWCWHQNGNLHRDGNKPAEIGFVDGSRKALTGIGFYRNGLPHRENGREASFEFDPDGTAYDGAGNVIPFDGFDESWLPFPVPTLVIPNSFLKMPAAKP